MSPAHRCSAAQLAHGPPGESIKAACTQVHVLMRSRVPTPLARSVDRAVTLRPHQRRGATVPSSTCLTLIHSVLRQDNFASLHSPLPSPSTGRLSLACSSPRSLASHQAATHVTLVTAVDTHVVTAHEPLSFMRKAQSEVVTLRSGCLFSRRRP
jgi:hypothetical protein